MDILDKLLETDPDNSFHLNHLASCHNDLAVLYTHTRRPDDAESAYRKVLEIREKLPDTLQFATDLGITYGNIGRLWSQRGKPEAALDWHTKAVDKLEGVLNREPRHPKATEHVLLAFWGQVEALEQLGRHAEAVRGCDRALRVSEGLAGHDLWLARRAWIHARAGDHARATAEAAQVAAKELLPAEALYEAACVYGISIRLVRQDTALNETDREKQAEHYARQALDLLERAMAAGYFNAPGRVEHLKKDADLEPLRSRTDFKSFQSGLERKVKAGANGS